MGGAIFTTVVACSALLGFNTLLAGLIANYPNFCKYLFAAKGVYS
jgi:hypothetical protein